MAFAALPAPLGDHVAHGGGVEDKAVRHHEVVKGLGVIEDPVKPVRRLEQAVLQPRRRRLVVTDVQQKR